MITGAEILRQTYRTIESYSEDKYAIFKAPALYIALPYLNQMLQEWAHSEIVDIKIIEHANNKLDESCFKNAIIYNLAWIISVHWGHAVDMRLKRQADWSLRCAMRARTLPPAIVDRHAERMY